VLGGCYEHYLRLIIDCKTPQSVLLQTFPAFYEEMLEPIGDITNLTKPALKSLEIRWVDPVSSESSYESEVIQSLHEYLDSPGMDKQLLSRHIKEVLTLFAQGFAEQEGEAYLFGQEASTESPEYILNQGVSLNVLDKFQTHSKSVENAFGSLDMLLNKFGPAGFEKASQIIQITSCEDLLFDGKY
jgi:hypothetical protein